MACKHFVILSAIIGGTSLVSVANKNLTNRLFSVMVEKVILVIMQMEGRIYSNIQNVDKSDGE